MKSPRISGRQVWRNHERRVLGIVKRALDLLRSQDGLDVCEDTLNRRLLFCIRNANAELAKHNEGIDCPITYEGQNQPDADDKDRAARESKRPDFQWGFTDRTEDDPLRQDKFYVIECKRLGEPVRKEWVFNRNYVEHGILRFVRAKHGYGRSAPSGAMIGYIRSMSSGDILDEVNLHAKSVSGSTIKLSYRGWVEKGVSRLNQELDRPEVPPTPFELRHLWADLREERFTDLRS